jgi:hypothetical protein
MAEKFATHDGYLLDMVVFEKHRRIPSDIERHYFFGIGRAGITAVRAFLGAKPGNTNGRMQNFWAISLNLAGTAITIKRPATFMTEANVTAAIFVVWNFNFRHKFLPPF